ncbi:MAG: ribonuclease P protein component [Thermohalobaculum sp.]|nr:ribonuclease P protein component [Thermohalobaculum sp.]
MTDTDPPPARHDAAAGGVRLSGPPPATLRKRADFLACARALKQAAPGMVVQARRRIPADEAPPRVGYTCSKKVGGAVARNRAKRRLREAARAVIGGHGRPGWDYVLIGRAGATAARPFEALVGDLESALARLHAVRRQGATA